MNQRLDIQTQQKQQQKLTQKQIYSINMLQMTVSELVTEIYTALEANPLLEIDDKPTSKDNYSEVEQSENINIRDMVLSEQWDSYIGHQEYSINQPPQENQSYENFNKMEETLYEYLIRQISYSGLSDEIKSAALYIVGNLDGSGFFSSSYQDVVEDLDCTAEDFDQALQLARSLDPAGIAAESLQESIMAQLRTLSLDEKIVSTAGRLLRDFEKEIISGRIDKIAKSMKTSEDEILYVLSYIKRVDPAPGRDYKSSSISVVPDVYIKTLEDGSFSITLNDRDIPKLKTNSMYKKYASNEDQSVAKYVEERYKSAEWLINSIDKRNKSIYQVVEAILDFQGEFLLKGEAYMKPLKLSDIAEVTGLHESTVSRATAGKYAMTELGMIELKAFFSKGVSSYTGEDASIKLVKKGIKEIIFNEDMMNPLSDQEIVAQLSLKGYKVARRTIAKYREEMKIGNKFDRLRTGRRKA